MRLRKQGKVWRRQQQQQRPPPRPLPCFLKDCTLLHRFMDFIPLLPRLGLTTISSSGSNNINNNSTKLLYISTNNHNNHNRSPCMRLSPRQRINSILLHPQQLLQRQYLYRLLLLLMLLLHHR
jgi:hypothetical protein